MSESTNVAARLMPRQRQRCPEKAVSLCPGDALRPCKGLVQVSGAAK